MRFMWTNYHPPAQPNKKKKLENVTYLHLVEKWNLYFVEFLNLNTTGKGNQTYKLLKIKVQFEKLKESF